MSELTEHYRRLLGLDEAWQVAKVDFRPEEKRVEITVEHGGARDHATGRRAGTPATLDRRGRLCRDRRKELRPRSRLRLGHDGLGREPGPGSGRGADRGGGGKALENALRGAMREGAGRGDGH